MSNTDSFVDEVNEELQRDRLYAVMKRYGWIAILLVLVLVGGAAWREYSKAQAAARAQGFGDSILAALDSEDEAARAAALAAIEAPGAGGAAILKLMQAAEEGSAGNEEAAVAQLQAVANDTNVPSIYRQIASYKAIARGASVLSVEERRAGLEALAVPGQPLRLLAEEQLALIEIETGAVQDALARLQRIVEDSEVTAGLRRRASQLIVALGGTVDNG